MSSDKQESPSPDREIMSCDYSPQRELSRSPRNIRVSKSPISQEDRKEDSYEGRRDLERQGSYREDKNKERHRDLERRRRSHSRSPSRKRRYSRNRSRSGERSYRRRHSRSPRRSRHAFKRENPEPSCVLGVFGMNVNTSEDEVRHVFSKYGPIERVQLIVDNQTGRSRGFGFIYFKYVEDAKEARAQCTGMNIDGKNIRVDFSITRRPHTPTPGIYMGKPTIRTNERNRSDHRRRRGDEYAGRSRYSRRSPSPFKKRGGRRSRSRSRSRSHHRY